MSIALNIQQLEKSYGTVHALKGIDLEVKAGDFFALLGPNGAGKSTTIGIVTSLLRKTKGNVHIFGFDIETQASRAKACVGVVPQEINCGMFDQVEHILLYQAGFYGVPLKLAQERSEKYLKQLDLWHKRKQQFRTLSTGMKRRLMIARALMHEPKLLILDEPTAGVDAELRRSAWDFLVEMNRQGTTIILTTHYLEEAEQLCQRIAILDNGEIVANDNTHDLLSRLQHQHLRLDLINAISALPQASGFEFTWHNSLSLDVTVPNGLSLNDLFSYLDKESIKVQSITQRFNRLESLFFELTGKYKHDLS